MTISNEDARSSLITHDGVTATYNYSFQEPDSENVAVYVKTPTADQVKLVNPTHFTVAVDSDSLGGVVTLVTPGDYANLSSIRITRETPRIQSTRITNSGGGYLSAIEGGLDELTRITQELTDRSERSIFVAETEEDVFDAQGFRIGNIAVPVDAADAATRSFVLDQVGTGYSTSISPNGTDDDTSDFQSAVDVGGIVGVNPGTYYLDQINITTEVHLVLAPGAILVQRSGTASADQAVLYFDAGSDYSTVSGGQFDGNYAELEPLHTDEVWTAIRIANGPEHLRFSDLHIYDFMHAGWYCGRCTYSVFTSIHVENCGKGCIHQQADNCLIDHVTFQDISNHNKAIYQHAVEIRDSDDLSISNVRVIDFAPDNDGLEPIPLGIAFERMLRLRVSGITVTGFAGVTKPGLGFVFDTCSFSHIDGITVDDGYDSGGAIKSCVDSTFDGINIDLHYNTAGDGVGLRILGAGLYPAIGTGLTAENARSNAACRNVRVSNSYAIRCEMDGFLVQSGGVTLCNCLAMGCNSNGFRVSDGVENTLFVGAPSTRTNHVVLDACQGLVNGASGLLITTGEDISIRGGTYSNNGQDTGASANARAGIRVFDGDRISIVDVNASDTQVWATKTDVVSYEPGVTVSDAYTVSLSDPAQLNVGQYVILRDAGGAGVHATGRITMITLDEIKVVISGGFTFDETGNTVALTGTFNTVEFTLTGSGAALDTEIAGRTWVTDGSDWRQIIRTNSADSGVIGEEFPVDLIAATLTKVTCDLDPVLSQQNGVRVESTVTELFASGLTGSGNVLSLWSVASAASVAAIEPSGNERPSIASAGTFTVPNGYRHVLVTGTTSITTISAGFAGRLLVLEFEGVLTVTDGSNLKLAGNFVTTADDTITLVSDGTNWIEVCRSAN